MTYATQESSIASGAPYFLYEFTDGTTTWYYTDFTDTVTWNSIDWEPFPIKHTAVKQSKEISKNALTITIPITGTFADLFIGWSPAVPVSVTIRRGHFGAADVLVYWKGRIAGHDLIDQTIALKCESIFTSLRRAGVRALFQRTCRHALYSPQCGVDKDDFDVAGTVTNVSNTVLTITEASGEADGYFNGGIVEFLDGSFSLISTHAGATFTLFRASRYAIDTFSTSGSFAVTLYPGCDRTIATCKDKFDNIENNGGFRWIPSKNPLGGQSIV